MGYPMRVLSRMMAYAEFLGWAREFAIEPFDDRRCFDQPAAEIRALYVNSHRAKNKPVVSLTEFMPYRDKVTSAANDVDQKILGMFPPLPQAPPGNAA